MLISDSTRGPGRGSRESQPSNISFLRLWERHLCLEDSPGMGKWLALGLLGREVQARGRETKLRAPGSCALCWLWDIMAGRQEDR